MRTIFSSWASSARPLLFVERFVVVVDVVVFVDAEDDLRGPEDPVRLVLIFVDRSGA
jgi:hypothetical protein